MLIKYCPYCDQENAHDAKTCVWCNDPFPKPPCQQFKIVVKLAIFIAAAAACVVFVW